MNQLSIELPEEIPVEEARIQLAISLYESRMVTQGQAAQIAGYSRATFLEICGKRGVSFTNITPDEFEEELETWRELRSPTAPP